MATTSCNCSSTSATADLEFVGGTAVSINFPTFFGETGEPLDLTGYTANFSLVKDTNWRGTPVLSKAMTIVPNDNGDMNSLYVELSSSDTIDLAGRYIYQIAVNGNSPDVPHQGVVHIINNINKDFFR